MLRPHIGDDAVANTDIPGSTADALQAMQVPVLEGAPGLDSLLDVENLSDDEVDRLLSQLAMGDPSIFGKGT